MLPEKKMLFSRQTDGQLKDMRIYKQHGHYQSIWRIFLWFLNEISMTIFILGLINNKHIDIKMLPVMFNSADNQYNIKIHIFLMKPTLQSYV